MSRISHATTAPLSAVILRRRWLSVLALGVLLLMAGGCVPPPIQTMSDARQTIEAARAAGAANCAAAELATVTAQRWLENARYALRIRDFPMARRSARRAQRWAHRALIILHAAPPPAGTPARLLRLCPPQRVPKESTGAATGSR